MPGTGCIERVGRRASADAYIAARAVDVPAAPGPVANSAATDNGGWLACLVGLSFRILLDKTHMVGPIPIGSVLCKVSIGIY
jgi:hypothetical protein